MDARAVPPDNVPIVIGRLRARGLGTTNCVPFHRAEWDATVTFAMTVTAIGSMQCGYGSVRRHSPARVGHAVRIGERE